jgi:hypothetical protein
MRGLPLSAVCHAATICYPGNLAIGHPGWSAARNMRSTATYVHIASDFITRGSATTSFGSVLLKRRLQVRHGSGRRFFLLRITDQLRPALSMGRFPCPSVWIGRRRPVTPSTIPQCRDGPGRSVRHRSPSSAQANLNLRPAASTLACPNRRVARPGRSSRLPHSRRHQQPGTDGAATRRALHPVIAVGRNGEVGFGPIASGQPCDHPAVRPIFLPQ